MRVGHSIVCLCLRVWTVEVVDVQMETRRRQFVEEAKSFPKPQNPFGAARAKLFCEDFQTVTEPATIETSIGVKDSKVTSSQATDGSVTFYEICAPRRG